MSVFSNPKSLYIVRLVQFFFSLGFLVVECYSGVHRGWWTWWGGLNGALAVGVIAVLFTFAITLHGIIIHHKASNPFSNSSTARTVVRLILEVLTFLLWIAAATLALRYPKNCSWNAAAGKCWAPTNGVTTDERDLSDQPVTEWDIAIAFSFVEIVVYALSSFLVFKDERSGKVGSGPVSYA